MALNSRPGPAPGFRRIPTTRPQPENQGNFVPHPDAFGSGLFLLVLIITGFFMDGKTPTDVARFGAIGTALGLALSMICDARLGLRNLVRADLLALISLFYLTFLEFLFPQPDFAMMVDRPSTSRAVVACLTGFAGLVVGRHLLPLKKQPFGELFSRPVSTTLILGVFIACFLIGFSYMLGCSDFNPSVMVNWFFEPRFSQPWSREALGDSKALLHELEMFLFLVPPLGGVIFARRKRYSILSLVVVASGVLFVLFYGFCTGTRYYFAAYLITFLAGFAFAASPKQTMEVIVASVCGAGLMFVATVLMLEFRHDGLRAYLNRDYDDYGRQEDADRTFYVDYNLYVISRIVDTFPRQHHYLGLEIPFLAIIRPVPRALWPKKPEGMSYSIEDVVNADGWTVAATFIGEAYMSGGFLAVFLIGGSLGALASGWNLLASPRNSEFGVLIYASGFFAAAIAMRSVLVLTTALLPSAAGLVAGYFLIRKLPKPKPPRRDLTPTSTAIAGPKA